MPSEMWPESSKPIRSSESNLEIRTDSRDKQTSRTVDKTISPRPNRSVKLPERFDEENANFSYAYLHHEITKNIKDIPRSENRQRHWIQRNVTENDELVKPMSNLPSYLESGENLKEEALNVGVLDWGGLEKRQNNNNQISHRSRRYSSSSCNTSSSFSTYVSSSHSSRGHSCSPACQQMHHPTLKPHLIASPREVPPQVVKSYGEKVGLKAPRSNFSNGFLKIPGKNQHFCIIRSEINLEQSKRDGSGPKMVPGIRTLPSMRSYEVESCSKGKMKTREGELIDRAENSPGPNSDVIDQDFPKRHDTVVLLLPRDLPQTNHSRVSEFSDSTTRLSQRSAEARRRSFSEISREVNCAKPSSDIPHYCPLPFEVHSTKHSQIKGPRSIDAESMKFLSHAAHSVPHSGEIGISPSRGRILEASSKELDLKEGKVACEKVRSSSPFRIFNIGMGMISKSSSSKEGSAVPRLSSAQISAKSVSENSVASACSNASSSEKPNASGRARSSPLRRLLDPFLKPKAANCHHVAEPLEKDSILTEKTCNVQSGRVKLEITNCRPINVDDSYRDKKHGSAPIQALLRVAFKNGLPLFTFAVDNESDILAATMKSSSTSRKDEYCWVYTFFAVQEVKKKNGSWINQGGKGKKIDYIPNVVAQMKVCEYQFSNLIRPNTMDQFSGIEFVMFAVDQKQADQQISDFQPNDELAAIVLKIPKNISRSIIKDGSIVSGQDLISATVILPSGVHSLPSKGEPSSLIERWKSGGTCDCGGWDLGCKLGILSNQNQLGNNLSSSKAYSSANRFDLFSQGVQESKPVFSLAPFKDGIYSVEFNSSLSLLQAFSICIAVLDSRKLCRI